MKKYFSVIISVLLALILVGCGSNTTQKKVPVVNAPTISEFTATSTTITVGEETTLKWTIEGTDPIRLEITNLSEVTGTSAVVSPTETTSYTLTATNSAGSATEELSIVVNPVPTPAIKDLIPSVASPADSKLWCDEYKVAFIAAMESQGFTSDLFDLDCYEISGSREEFKANMTSALTDAGYSMTTTNTQTTGAFTATAEGWQLGLNQTVIGYLWDDWFVVVNFNFDL